MSLNVRKTIFRSLSEEASVSLRWNSVKVFVFMNTELEKEKEVLQKLRGNWSVKRSIHVVRNL